MVGKKTVPKLCSRRQQKKKKLFAKNILNHSFNGNQTILSVTFPIHTFLI